MVASSKTMVSSLCFSHFQWQTVFHLKPIVSHQPLLSSAFFSPVGLRTSFPPFVEELAMELFSTENSNALPFPIQAQAWPCALAGFDVIAVAPTGAEGDGVEFTTWGFHGGRTVIEWCYNSDLMGIDCWSKGDDVRYITDNTLCNVSENNGDTPKLAIRTMKNKLKLRVFHFRTDPSEYMSVTKRGLL